MKHIGIVQSAALSALGVATGFAIWNTSTAWAQDTASPAPVLTFGFDQRFEYASNATQTANPARSLQSNTQLSFGLSDATARSTFDLTGRTGLRLVDRPAASGVDVTMSDPAIALAYTRLGATARLDIKTGFRINDIAYLRPLTDFANTDGSIDLPLDFADLQGSGTRQSLNFDAQLSLRDDAPFGLVLGAAVTDLRYRDVTDPDLIDNQRLTLRATGRFDIDDVTQLKVGLSYANYVDDDQSSQTLGLNSGLTITRPDGDLHVSFGLDDADAGLRSNIGFGRNFDLPNGNFSFDLGFAQSVDSGVNLTGALGLTQEFAKGRLTADLRQGLTVGVNDREKLQSALNIRFTQDLGPLTSVNLGLAFASSEDVISGETARTTDLSVSFGYALSPDWRLNAGYSYRNRDDDLTGQGQDSTVFVGLNRSFEFPL